MPSWRKQQSRGVRPLWLLEGSAPWMVREFPAVSDDAKWAISRTIKRWRLHLWSAKTPVDLAQSTDKYVRGWINRTLGAV
jgi:hypothetical protein